MLLNKSRGPLSLRKNFTWMWIGNGVYFASQWGLLAALAKLGNVNLVGHFSLASAIVSPIIIFSQMQLRQVAVTDTKDEYQYQDYFWCRAIATVMALGAVGITILILRYSWYMSLVMLYLTLGKGFESMSDIVYGKLQKFERMDYIAISMMVKGVSTLVLFSFLLWITKDMLWSLAGMVLIWAGVFFLYDFRISEHFSKTQKFDINKITKTFKALSWLSLPLTINTVLVSVSSYMPRYFLEYTGGKEAVGLFSVASAPLVFITLFHNSLGQAVMHRASSSYQNGDYNKFIKLTLQITVILFLISFLFTSVFYIFGDRIITLLFSKQYIATVPVLVIMSFGVTINVFSVFGFMVIVSGRMFSMQMIGIIITVILQVPLCYFLTKGYGILGAGWADFSKTMVNMLFLIIAGSIAFRSARNRESQRCSCVPAMTKG